MEREFENRIAVVTGGGSGIGRAVARRLAGAGAGVTIANRSAASGRAVATEIGARFVATGIRVNCVCPGTVDTPWIDRVVDEHGESRDALAARQPLGRLGTPDEIADAVVYLASDRAASTIGSQLVVDGGVTAG